MTLPELPEHTFVIVEQRASLDPPGFLSGKRTLLRVRFADGTLSEPFEYDSVGRSRLDAVIVVPHYRGKGGARHVILRSGLRPPLAMRSREESPIRERASLGALWEVVAGLVEVDERTPEGLKRCAARELAEELGAEVSPSAVHELGPSTFPAPGVIAERHFYFHVEVDPERLVAPTEDGSALERQARFTHVELGHALDLARAGELEDAKTELALRRLAELPL